MAGRSTSGASRPRRQLTAVLVAGAAGAALVLLATRQHLARVVERPPRPLPGTVTAVSAQELRPAIAALAVAALASLAAVLATRGFLRRLTGLITAALGGAIALLGAGSVPPAAVLAAAGRAGGSPAGGSAGSVTAGSGQPIAPGSFGGFPARVLFEGSAWRVLMIAGATLVIAAGIVIVARAGRLPAMSGRYNRPPLPAAGQDGHAAAGGMAARSAVSAGQDADLPGGESMWESLSAGADPTVWPE
jgi:uncharacterized membrane protein (TIGR02234 family)